MSFKKITLIGNLGRDPELRYTPQGDAVCNFSVAVTEKKKNKSGEHEKITDWFRVTVWRKSAENCSKYLTKGSSVFVEGTPSIETWTDRDGKTRTSFEVTATEIQFLSGGSAAPEKEDAAQAGEFSGPPAGDGESKAAAAGDDDSLPF